MVSEVSADTNYQAADGAGSWSETARDRVSARFAFLDRPLTSFYLVLGITTLLLALGLVMVLSTSSATGLMNGISPWSGLQHQLFGVLIGLPCMWVAAKCSPPRFRAAAYPLMFISLLGLVLVPFIGVTTGGAARWLQIGPVQFQPSELAKLAFVLWGADLLARKEKLGQLEDWRQLLIPLLPGVAIMALLVMMGDDLGTTFMLLIIFLALLWIIGTPGRLMLGMLAIIGLVLLIMIVVEPWRLKRLTGYLGPAGSPVGPNQQSIQGKWAVGSGGWFGVGLGASREKWGWVPEVDDRLHLRDPGRGTGPARHALRDVPLRGAGVRRAADRPPGPGHLHAAGRRGGHRLDRGPGAGEHGCGPRPAADYRGAPAAGLLGPVLPARDHGGARHADVVRQA